MNCQHNVNVLVECNGSVIHYSPQAIEKSYSPLIETDNAATAITYKEPWKQSTALQHSQSTSNGVKTIKQWPQVPLHVTLEAPSSELTSKKKSKKKELPPISMIRSTHNTPCYDSSFSHYKNTAWLSPLRYTSSSYHNDRSFHHQQYHQEPPSSDANNSEGNYLHTNHWMNHQSRHSLSTHNDYYAHSPTGVTITEKGAANSTKEDRHFPRLLTGDVEILESSSRHQTLSPETHDHKRTRQIIVKCIGDDYLASITIEPGETGLSIAKKIEVLAGFRACAVTSITTASGEKIALNNRPIFMHAASVDSLQREETWTVTWGSLKKRSMMDTVLSKLIRFNI